MSVPNRSAWPLFRLMLSCIIGGSCQKYNFCRDKRRVLSQPQYACRNKTFVATDKRNFVATEYFCHDQTFVATSICVCRDNFFLSRQAYFCCDKRCVLSRQKRVCHDKWACRVKIMFVATNICHDKAFVGKIKQQVNRRDTHDTDQHRKLSALPRQHPWWVWLSMALVQMLFEEKCF